MESKQLMTRDTIKTIRVTETTWRAVRALRSFGLETDESMEDVIKKLITFYLKKHDESKRKVRLSD